MKKKQSLIRAIISMAQALGMKTIAEGVECQEELDFLEKEHCDQYQGFFFGKPKPEEKCFADYQQGLATGALT